MILWRIIIHFTFLLPWITVWKVLLFSKNLGFLFFISLFNFQCSGAALVSDSSKSISYLLSLVKTFFKLFSSFFKSFFAPVPMPSLLSLFQTRSAFPSLICVPYFITLLPLLSTPFSTFFILFFTLCTPSRAFVGSHTLNYTISCIPLAVYPQHIVLLGWKCWLVPYWRYGLVWKQQAPLQRIYEQSPECVQVLPNLPYP